MCHLCSVANTTESLSENKFSNKKQLFGLWRKHLSYNFHLWENVYHSLYVCNCMELHENKFLIYENCLISIFGQPGRPCLSLRPSFWVSTHFHSLTSLEIFFAFPEIFIVFNCFNSIVVIELFNMTERIKYLNLILYARICRIRKKSFVNCRDI